MDRRSKAAGNMMEGESIFRIPPYYYLHVLDQNTNVTRVEIGPKTYIRQDNEKVSLMNFFILNMYSSCQENIS